VRSTDIDWQGECTPPGAKWEWYKTMPAGIRAGMLSIFSKWKRGAHTPYDITKAYAPESDGNDVEAYAGFIAKRLGLKDAHQYIDLSKPDVALKYALAVLAIENGVFAGKNIDLATVKTGVNMALTYCGFPTL